MWTIPTCLSTVILPPPSWSCIPQILRKWRSAWGRKDSRWYSTCVHAKSKIRVICGSLLTTNDSYFSFYTAKAATVFLYLLFWKIHLLYQLLGQVWTIPSASPDGFRAECYLFGLQRVSLFLLKAISRRQPVPWLFHNRIQLCKLIFEFTRYNKNPLLYFSQESVW